MLETAVTAFTIFFVTIDPLGMVPLFVALTHDLTPAARRAAAWKSVSLATLILLVFAVAGRPLLVYLGVTLSAFRIAGGVLLLLVAIEMVLGHGYASARTPAGDDASARTRSRADVTVFPLAVPLIAGPGALTSAMLLHDIHVGDPIAQTVIAVVMIGVLVLVWIGFLLAVPTMKLIGVNAIHVFSRVLGIVLAAVAVNNIVEGIRVSFPALGGAG
ncbi:MAG: MarC family protein [Rhodospirillaceae bacterium]|nr:MAG: MarC family protein [Rhodospirillaceae bacterium]